METYLYFAENLGANAAGDCCVYPASTFTGIDPVSDTTTRISFKALAGTAADDDILVTHVTGKFKSIAQALANALSDDSGELVVFMDEDNTIYSKMLRDLGCIDSSTALNITLG
jgi:cellulose synthase/poly-beta-1,6-N-acetylglucosamine synthase-like glycosyltransferase